MRVCCCWAVGVRVEGLKGYVRECGSGFTATYGACHNNAVPLGKCSWRHCSCCGRRAVELKPLQQAQATGFCSTGMELKTRYTQQRSGQNTRCGLCARMAWLVDGTGRACSIFMCRPEYAYATWSGFAECCLAAWQTVCQRARQCCWLSLQAFTVARWRRLFPWAAVQPSRLKQ